MRRTQQTSTAQPRAKDTAAFTDLSPRARRRLTAVSILRSLLMTCAALVGYAVLPLNRPAGVATLLTLALGLAGLAALIVWDLRRIARSVHPRLRAVQALASVVPLFLLLFSAIYVVMSQTDEGSFSMRLTRVDAVYFAVTVFATVGFGDIAPVTQAARLVVTVQMLADLVVVGLVARVLLGAVRVGLRRQEEGRDPDRGGRPTGWRD